MDHIFSSIWGFLKNEENRTVLIFIGGTFSSVIALIITSYLKLKSSAGAGRGGKAEVRNSNGSAYGGKGGKGGGKFGSGGDGGSASVIGGKGTAIGGDGGDGQSK